MDYSFEYTRAFRLDYDMSFILKLNTKYYKK